MKQFLLVASWVSLVTYVLLGSTNSSAKIYEQPERLVMPTADEFILMTHEQRVEVISAIQDFVRAVEMKQPQVYGEFRQSPLWRQLWVDEAFAASFRQGASCIIGGYSSSVTKKGSWLGCPTPAFDSWWAKDMNAKYKCDPVGARTILCNPLVFGYPGSTDGTGCKKITNSLTKDCGTNAKSADEVAKDLVRALTEGGKELDTSSAAWNQLMAGFKDLEGHCGVAGTVGAYNESECGVLGSRIGPIRDALLAAYKKQESDRPKTAKCSVNSEKWREIQIVSFKDGKSKVSVFPKSGAVRTHDMPTPNTREALAVQIPESGSDPGLVLKADAGFKTCSISEVRVATTATTLPPHDPCTGGEKDGWKDKCSFVDARTLCRQIDKGIAAMTNLWGRSESRKFGPQGLIGGKPELGKLIREKRVQATLLRPTEVIEKGRNKVVQSELAYSFLNSLSRVVPSKGIRDMSNFDAQLQKIEDRCKALNKSGGVEEDGSNDKGKKKKSAKKTKDTFHVVKLDRASDMAMYTCQRISKDFDPSKPLDPDHILFSKGLAMVVHRGVADSPKEGFVEFGEIDEQGDFTKSKLYRPGYFLPIAERERDKDSKQKDAIGYRLGGLNLCPDTVEGSQPVQYKIYTKGNGTLAVCSGSGGKFTPATDLHGHSVANDDLNLQTGEFKYVARSNSSHPKTCDLFLGVRQIPTVESVGAGRDGGSGGGAGDGIN